jgi:hypothetical protein
MMPWLQNPLDLAAGAAPRLFWAAVLLALLWVAIFWAMRL